MVSVAARHARRGGAGRGGGGGNYSPARGTHIRNDDERDVEHPALLLQILVNCLASRTCLQLPIGFDV